MKYLKNKIRNILTISTILLLFVSSTKMYETSTILEKVYTQTDRPFYFPGETIWFKSYVVNAENKPSFLNDMMYAELISPKGAVVKKLKLNLRKGYAYGDFTLEEDWVGGIYTIKMYTEWMKNYGETSFFTKKISVQKIVQPKLLMKLDFEKKAYGKNAHVTANFEVKTLDNLPLSFKTIPFEVRLKGKTTHSSSTTTDRKGKTKVQFTLPSNLNSSDIVLNVLVPHKGSKESISRSVPVILDNVDLQFFPESGKSLVGYSNKIAFKALNEFGNPADVSGEITDENGNFITNFNSYHDGMGAFYYTPISNTKYYAKITKPFVSDKQILLPKAQVNGIIFSLLNQQLSIYSSKKQKVVLQIKNAQKKLYNEKIQLDKGANIVSINSKKFPIGITSFLITTPKGEPICERLAFMNANKDLKIEIIPNKNTYETREKVSLKIKTTDKNGKPIPSNLALSVVDNKILSFADDKQDNILSSLLVSSELKGTIHEPKFYFDEKEHNRELALDYVMLTHGWRDYIKKPITAFEEASYLPVTKSIQTGKVIDADGNGIKASLLLFDNYSDKVLKFETNEKGLYSFKIGESRGLTLIAYREDKQHLTIIKNKVIDKENLNSVLNYKVIPDSSEVKVFENNKKPLQKAVKQKVVTGKSIANLTLEADNALEEVVVTAQGLKREKKALGYAVSTVGGDDLENLSRGDIASVLNGKAAGVQITQSTGLYGSTANVIIRGFNTVSGNNQPLYIIDGIPYENLPANNAVDLDATNIDSVTVLKGLAASTLYGSEARNGVIAITTKNNRSSYSGKKIFSGKKFNNYSITNFYYYNKRNDFYHAKSFYVPVYEGKHLPEERTDFRKTIYWNPIIETNENGEANLEFYNSDAITSFKITAEGLGFNGLIGRNEVDYNTKKMMHISFKSPNYMSVNDEVILPVVITNNSKEEITGNLDLSLSKYIEIIDAGRLKEIHLKPDAFYIANIKIKPVEKAENIILEARFTSEKYLDVFKEQATILSPYFPTEVSMSGSKNESYRFNVDNVVPNTLKANFNVYTDIVGDVMNGIEGIIRRPSGCFEQVSSSTYPNILVLQYLNETGKINPEIHAKALEYIADGYKKLAAYETSKNGFEWYGRTPPHEALSAYGLMEFTEMKKVYGEVDEQMIDRTVKWLLSRRDGMGGFKQKRGKYGFSAAPAHVNNAYIVYAISESGTNVDIQQEYKATYEEALKSEDLYRMALLACASKSLKKEAQFNTLLTKIKYKIQDQEGFENLKIEETITRSYGTAKNVEATAFVLLALLKENNSETLVAKGIEYLLSQRKYGRFGSTQSTSMALKALIEYTKTQKRKVINSDDTIEFAINGHKLNSPITMDSYGKITFSGIEQYITNGTQEVNITFSNSKNTFPYSLDITWDNYTPDSSKECKVDLSTAIDSKKNYTVGDIARMEIKVSNTEDNPLPMTTTIIGIPSGTSPQPWQLKELLEQENYAYYEVFDNYLVFYWRELGPNEIKTINLDLKVDIAGTYKAPASTVYLYYADEFKKWVAGDDIEIKP